MVIGLPGRNVIGEMSGIATKSCDAKVEGFREWGRVTLAKLIRDYRETYRSASSLTLSLHQMRARKSPVNLS